jgi:hypothetical protein
MNKTILIASAILSVFHVGTPALVSGQHAVDLNKVTVTIRAEKQPLGAVLRYLMERYDLCIGYEQSMIDRNKSDYDFHTNLPKREPSLTHAIEGDITATTTSEKVFKAPLHPITISFDRATMNEVLDEIVRQMDNYKWEYSNGVVNITPIKGRDSRFEKLLSLKVNNFKLETGRKVEDITTNITLLPEFRKFVTDNNFQLLPVREGFNFVIEAQYGKPIEAEMNFSDITFRDLLNRITRSKRGGWILKWKRFNSKAGREVIDLDI